MSKMIDEAIEHLKSILKLQSLGLDISFATKYSLNEIDYKCSEILNKFPQKEIYQYYISIQKKLLSDESFFYYLKEVIDKGYDLKIFNDLLANLEDNNLDIMNYPIYLLETLFSNSTFNSLIWIHFLEFCKDMTFSETIKIILDNIIFFYHTKIEIIVLNFSNEERKIFQEAFISNKLDKSSQNDIRRIISLCIDNKEIFSLLKFTYSNDIDFKWNISNLETIKENSKEILCILYKIWELIGKNSKYMSKLLIYWSNNNLMVDNLLSFKENLAKICSDEIDKKDISLFALNREINYWNMVKNNVLPNLIHETNNLSIYELDERLINIIIYSFKNNKNNFLTILSENANYFLYKIYYSSILFQPVTYESLLNIDSLTLEDIEKLNTIKSKHIFLTRKYLSHDEYYTCNEFIHLFCKTDVCICFYHKLNISDLNLKIKTFEEIEKYIKSTYDKNENNIKMNMLAKSLSLKSISQWLTEDFKNIKNLTEIECIHLLEIYDYCEPLIKEMTNVIEAVFVITHFEIIKDYKDIKNLEYIKNHATYFDGFWMFLETN